MMMAAKMGQTPQTRVMMRLVLAGAITIWENQGSEVSAMLMRDNNRRLFDAMDAIGTALYWVDNELADTLIPETQKK